MAKHVKKVAKKAAKKKLPKEEEVAPQRKQTTKSVKSLGSIWDLIKTGYEAAPVDRTLLARSKSAKPYDMRIFARITDGTRPSEYSITMTDFFIRNPMASFKRVVFLQPKPRRTSGRQPKNPPPPEMLAVFDSTLHQLQAAEITRKGHGKAAEINGKAYVLQLFQMFGIKVDLKPGALTELLIKLTPMIEGDDRDSRKVCRMTIFSQV